jgi:DNA-nicking Smr family endonuclease
MDFGDILDQWEKEDAKPRGPGISKKGDPGKSAAPGAERNAAGKTDGVSVQKISPLEKWLRINGVHDKDAEETGPGRNAAGRISRETSAQRRRRLLAKRPDALIDLHGLTGDEAWDALERFFADAKRRALEKILVIHGKGNHSESGAVLKRCARDFIERCPFAGENGHGGAAEGGSGVTWVLLK